MFGRINIFLTILILVISSVQASESPSAARDESNKDQEKMFQQAEEINSSYVKMIKPLFVKSCFDCHSNQTVYPWYHSVPIVNNLIDDDIVEAKKHLDLSDDFPFNGHGSIEEDLSAIKKEVEGGDMPPLGYKIMHPVARLKKTEIEIIGNWVQQSLQILNPQNK
jgi:hypothetical protein